MSEEACGPLPKFDPRVDTMSTKDLHARLDHLLELYEGHGLDVASTLRPPATSAQLGETEDLLGVTLPEHVVGLWTWRNGSKSDGSWLNVEGDSFDFRDNFITGTLDVANLRLGTNMYKDDRFDAGFDFDSLVPIAGFNGSIYAVTTGRQTVLPGHAHPVMNIFEGFYPQYHSIPSMVETAIAWVSEPGYVYCSEAPREGEIWRALNPDVFLK